MKPIIFWDFDGVISDSLDFTFSYWENSFADKGVIFTPHDFESSFKAKFPFEYLRENFGKIAEEIFSQYTIHEKENYANKVLFFPEIKSVINKLSDNFSHNIISSNLQEVITKTCEKENCLDFFDQIIGREISGYKDEKIIKILKSRDLNPAECYMIGDTKSDIDHGRKAGTQTIGVTWGVHSREILVESAPTFLVDKPEDLLKILT